MIGVCMVDKEKEGLLVIFVRGNILCKGVGP